LGLNTIYTPIVLLKSEQSGSRYWNVCEYCQNCR